MERWRMTLGACGLGAWCAAISMTACAVGPEDPVDLAPDEAERVDEAKQEVGEGDPCGSLSPCGRGLSCCRATSGSACRDLETDWTNCGGCGVMCNALQICSDGHCCPIGGYWDEYYCVAPGCVPDGFPCDLDADCCSGICAPDFICGL